MRKEAKYVRRADAEIKRAVKDAMLYDPRVLSFKPEVEVQNGMVTLTGIVDNLQAKKAAENDAKNTLGVWRVKNLLKVRPSEEVPDNEIAKSIRSALVRDPLIDKREVTVSVHNRHAYLYGSVESEFEKAHAENLTSQVDGLVDVSNYILVETAPVSENDWEVEQNIEEALYWNPFIESANIDVKVDDGIATLTGTVDSWNEYELAAQEAYDTDAWKVRNHLKVEYGPEELRPPAQE